MFSNHGDQSIYIHKGGSIVIDDIGVNESVYIDEDDWKSFVEAVNRIDKLMVLK